MDLLKNKRTYPFLTDNGTDLSLVVLTAQLLELKRGCSKRNRLRMYKKYFSNSVACAVIDHFTSPVNPNITFANICLVRKPLYQSTSLVRFL